MSSCLLKASKRVVQILKLFASLQVAAAAAYSDTGAVALSNTGTLLLGSIFIIAWLNLR